MRAPVYREPGNNIYEERREYKKHCYCCCNCYLYLCRILITGVSLCSHLNQRTGVDLRERMTASLCMEALEMALASGRKPQIFNTDQGRQYTSEEFQKRLRTFSSAWTARDAGQTTSSWSASGAPASMIFSCCSSSPALNPWHQQRQRGWTITTTSASIPRWATAARRPTP